MSLTIDTLTCARGGRTVLQGLSARFEAGTVTHLSGRNGAGKTTLLRALAGLLQPVHGAIRWQDVPLRKLETPVAGWLGDQAALKPVMRVHEDLRFWAAYGGAAAASIPAILARVGLEALADRRCGTLSAGQRRRLALARLMLLDRPMWLLDEPTNTLDQEGLAVLGAVLDDAAAQGRVIVASAHGPLPCAVHATLALESAL